MLEIQILDHPCKILIIGASGSGKTKDTYKPHINCLINKQKSTFWMHCNDSKAFIKYSNNINDICENI